MLRIFFLKASRNMQKIFSENVNTINFMNFCLAHSYRHDVYWYTNNEWETWRPEYCVTIFMSGLRYFLLLIIYCTCHNEPQFKFEKFTISQQTETTQAKNVKRKTTPSVVGMCIHYIDYTQITFTKSKTIKKVSSFDYKQTVSQKHLHISSEN